MASDYGADEVEVWPDNWEVVELFCDLSTQWRIGAAGPIGLDYSAIYPVLSARAIPRRRLRLLFDDIRILESEALEALREK